jgi:hypothetical protein
VQSVLEVPPALAQPTAGLMGAALPRLAAIAPSTSTRHHAFAEGTSGLARLLRETKRPSDGALVPRRPFEGVRGSCFVWVP